MAERRMFAKSIIDSDAFLDMPLSTQALYFHLSMRADDDGFVGNPKRIKGMIGASEDDLKLLIAKRFLLIFESGVVVIKHWKIHNYIRGERYNETSYLEEKSTLALDEKKVYFEKKNIDHSLYGDIMSDKVSTKCQTVRLPQVRLGKDSIGKDSIYKKEREKEKGNSETSSLSPLEKKNKKEQYIELVQASSLSTKIQEQILEWLEYKKWKYAEVGIKSLLTTVTKNVDKYGENAVCAVIVESMGNMWQGICWDKLDRKEQRQERKEEAEYTVDGEYLVFKSGQRVLRANYEAWGRKDN